MCEENKKYSDLLARAINQYVVIVYVFVCLYLSICVCMLVCRSVYMFLCRSVYMESTTGSYAVDITLLKSLCLFHSVVFNKVLLIY